ncbi:hypothetical protein RHSIM_Rhsim04G0248900 [Rhododendron simsii]|uniref:DUF4283 domain-containing protein n=1 Tax=Rhododendron simsii TaxID=118357 RepID=A0A834LQ00_RHOSS|nr:hypothetical protein RHSIM_Rhsim04G0248900 [Rhododendron simsii]
MVSLFCRKERKEVKEDYCGSPRAPSKNTRVVSSVNGARVFGYGGSVFGLHAPDSPVRGLDLLESVAILNEDHLKPCFTDMPAMCQIKELNAKNARLRRLLEGKVVSSGPGYGLSWSNIAAGGNAVNNSPGEGVKGVPESMVVPEKMKLEYIPPVILNDRVVVSPQEDVEELGQSKWAKCIVGHFWDKKLTFTAVRKIAMNIWARFGIRDVLSNEKGFFFFLFEGEKFHQLLESGPWHFGGKLLILKLWHPRLKLEKDWLSTIPLWVHFYNIPLELWTGPGFSYIASSDANGDVVEIKIHYPWKPMMCSDCMVFGHGSSTCPKKVVAKAQSRMALSSQERQVVGTLRQEAPGVGDIRPPSSLHYVPASTSRPTMVLVMELAPKRTVLDSGQHPSAKKSNRFDILQDATNDLIGSDSAGGVGQMDNLPDDLFDAPAEGLASVMAAIAADFSVVAPQVSSSPSISLSKGNVGKVGDNGPARKGRGGGGLGRKNVKFRIASWNIRDHNNPLKQKRLSLLLVCRSCAFVVFWKLRFDKKILLLLVSWSMLDNSGVQGVARIVLGWDPNLLGVSLVFSNFSSPQLLCVQVSCLESQKVFYVSSGYGANSMIDRGLSDLL